MNLLDFFYINIFIGEILSCLCFEELNLRLLSIFEIVKNLVFNLGRGDVFLKELYVNIYCYISFKK